MAATNIHVPKQLDVEHQADRESSILSQFSQSWASHLSPFLATLLQVLAILFLVSRFRLENDLFQLVTQVGVAGFVVHHWLPSRWRLPFFSLLSIGAIVYCFGLEQGQWRLARAAQRTIWFLAIGGGLISICHLPVRFAARVMLLLGAGAGLAYLRVDTSLLAVFGSVWPVFGAMFMFRVIIYLYDLTHSKERPRFWQTASYFFQFPNLWLYVAPLLDFKSFFKNHYNTDPFSIYQKGITWMVRGVFHLLLWRLVYYQVYVDPARITTGGELAQYLLGNVALYLRLSGQFHFLTGLLHLFGFNLAETHRYYFLASNFLDYWRRINIYWKDFIVKIFYYPLVVRLKKLGTTGSMVAGTAIAFAATWILHSYQFFWIRGTFPVDGKEALFWGLLGALVCLNMILELRTGRSRTLGKRVIGWGEKSGTGLRAAMTFMVLTLLWSIWTCDSLAQWLDIWRSANLITVLACLAAMTAIFLATLLFEGPPASWFTQWWRSRAEGSNATMWRQAFASCLIPAFLMTAATSSRVTSPFLTPENRAIVQSVFKNTPNKSDEEFMVRGYYESLADNSRFNSLQNDGFRSQPPSWSKLEDTDAIRLVMDLRTKELVPSKETIVNGKLIRTNRWGIRDTETNLEKPKDTIRIAILGASHEMGYGVNNGEVFADLLEIKLDQEFWAASGRHVEILNFAMNHYSPLAHVEVMKRKVVRFHPDAILLFAHPEDVGVTMRLFAQALRQGVQPDYQFLVDLARKADIDQKTPRSIAERRLISHWPSMIEWAYREIANECQKRGIRPVWVLQQQILSDSSSPDAVRLTEMARNAGYTVLTLEGVYKGPDPNTLVVAPWDAHPNALGHQMLAQGLFLRLKNLDFLKPPFPPGKAVTERHNARAAAKSY